MKFGDFVHVGFDFLFLFLEFVLVFGEYSGLFLDGFVLLFMFEVLLGQCDLLDIDFLLELTDLVVDDLVSPLDFSDLLLGLSEVLTIQIPVTSDGLVQVLLLFEFGLSFNILLLKLTDQIVLQLDLLQTMEILGLSLSVLQPVLLLLLVELLDRLI